MAAATKLNGQITADRKLIVEIPPRVPTGAVQVILVPVDAGRRTKKHKTAQIAHPAFGIWSDRTEISNSATFAAQLRQQVEDRSDHRG